MILVIIAEALCMSETEVYHTQFYQQRKLMKLPPSAKFILYLLKLKGPMNRKRIIQETLMPDRTVGFALKLLLNESLIEKEDPSVTLARSLKGKRRRKKQDRRITNYTLVSTILPYEMAEA
jgi:hypothetical protein